MSWDFSGPKRVEFSHRLGESWKHLANFLEIPDHIQAAFTQGNAADRIWQWLSVRNRLEELPEALAEPLVARTDLRDLFQSNASPGPSWQTPDEQISELTGLVDYYSRANDFVYRMPHYIDTAKQDVWLVGVNFYITVPEQKDRFLARLRAGVDVRFLVFNFLSPHVGEVAEGFGTTKASLMAECVSTMEGLVDIHTKAEGERLNGRFEVRLTDSEPRTRFCLFDRRSENGFTYFVPHVGRNNSPNLPGFLARNVEAGIAQDYIRSVEVLWGESTPLSDWIPGYEKFKSDV